MDGSLAAADVLVFRVFEGKTALKGIDLAAEVDRRIGFEAASHIALPNPGYPEAAGVIGQEGLGSLEAAAVS